MRLTVETILQTLESFWVAGSNENIVAQKRIQDIRIQDHTIQIIFSIFEQENPENIDQDLRAFFNTHFPKYTLALILTNHLRKKGLLDHIPHVIAIASGKGGVAKSTTTLYLSLALQQLGLKVGILDADIYGPSLPTMMGCFEKPAVNEAKKIIPLISHQVQWMSIGCLIPPKQALVWRGPMVQSALLQLIKDVAWPNLDILMIDLPPGTGDVHLTLAGQVSLTGVLVVSTPQEMALIDARKAINMFQKVDVPILGMIETMADFICPHCQHSTAIFDTQGVRKEAENQQLSFLGSIPLDPLLRQGCDQGQPLIAFQSQSPGVLMYKNIATYLKNQLY